MFRIIDRYLIKEILPYFFLSLFLLTAIIFVHEVNRFSELFVIFSRRGLSSWPLVRLAVSLLPSIFVFTLPMSLLLSILLGLGRMAGDSELIVLRASGIGRWRLFLPVLLMALIVSGITGYITAYLLPNAMASLNSLKSARSQLLLQGLASAVKPGVFEESVPNRVIFIRDIDRANGLWRQVFVANQTDPNAEPQILVANEGELRIGETLELSELNLYNGIIYESYQRKRKEQDKATTSSFEVTTLRFNLASRDDVTATAEKGSGDGKKEKGARDHLSELNSGAEVLTLPELLRAPMPTDQREARRLQVELHKRFALPFACLVFALTGVALGMAVSRGGRSSGLMIGIGVTLLYYLIFIFGEDIARQGVVPAALGIWLPNAVVGLFGWLMLTRYQWFSEHLSILWSRCEPVIMRIAKLLEGRDQRKQSTRVTFGFPRIIDRMIVVEMLRHFIVVLIGITVVFLVFTLFELTKNIVENRIQPGVIFTYLFFLIPQILHYAAPFAVLVSVLVTFGLFGKTSQLIALNASGQSLYRLAMPALLYAVLIGSFLFASQEYLLPLANQRQEYLRYLIKGGQLPPQTFYQTNRKWFLGQGNRLIHYEYFDHDKNTFAQLAVYELSDENNSLLRRINANKAYWDPQTKEWVLDNGFIRTFEGVQVKVAEKFRTMRLQMPEQPEYFKMSMPESSKMNTQQLLNQIEQLQASGIDVLNLRIALQVKFASPLICLVMALVGIPFALTIGKRGALAGVAVSIFIAIIFWGSLELFGQLGKYELLPPSLSAWGPNLLFSASGLYFLFTTKT